MTVDVMRQLTITITGEGAAEKIGWTTTAGVTHVEAMGMVEYVRRCLGYIAVSAYDAGQAAAVLKSKEEAR